MKREEELFEQARALTSAEARAGYLLEACGGDRELRRRVEELLAAHQEAGALEFLDADGPADKADPAQPEHRSSERPGDRIGRYKLLERIGEGGCGVVYVAEQEEPVQRRVALKVIKLGMDTRSVIARFEAERQALALMDHPNIAKVFDAGATETGRPYFVMELVRGIRITDYCDQKDLATIERLELFIQVCHAIQHAHQKGIIHRDIKPSNILVTRHDGVPVPKVIDFGIAKATGQQRLTDKTLYTAFEQVIGTPAYMSPEQADMSGLDIDTRSDIYSLGVLLYELLTGKTPFESKTLLAAGLDEMRRIIREQEPARPSTRLSKLAHVEQTTTAQCRQTEPPRLIRMLQGDLDWIAMKCLEKDRRRRYETANGLALDIKRHLDHEPVIARPPSAVYRMQKFARRNRLMVTAGAAVATALVLGVVVSTWLAIRATRAEVRAEAALHTMDFDAVNRLLASDGSADALALLARLLRQDPQDEVAAACLLNTLTTRSFCLPSMEPLLHDTKVSHARFSPDGAMVLTASGDHTVRLWDRLTGHLLVAPIPHRSEGLNPAVFSGPVHPVHALISPDGHWLATGSANGTARLWHRATGEPASPPLEHDDWVTCLAFRPDSGLLATGGKDGSVRLWQVSGGEPAGPVLRHRSWVNSVQFSPDGSMLATTSDDHTARVWQVPSGQPAGPPLTHQHGVREASFSPDGQRVVTASADFSARLWEVATGEPIGPPLNHDGVVVAASFSPDGTIVATASLDKTACLWTGLNTRPLVPPLRHEQEVRSVQFSPEGLRLVTGCADGTARIWEVMTGRELTEPMRHQGTVWSARFSPDGRQVLTASADGTAQLWDVRPGQALGVSLTGNSRALFVQWSPDGERLLIVDAGIARVWDATTGATADYFGLGYQGGVLCARFSPDGQRLVTGSGHGDARVWCGWGEQALTPPMRHAGPIRWIEFSPDGQRVVTASDDHTARLWDSRTAQPLVLPVSMRIGCPWPVSVPMDGCS
jgi:eukaryotic-like serine/threonine-protein kinase